MSVNELSNQKQFLKQKGKYSDLFIVLKNVMGKMNFIRNASIRQRLIFSFIGLCVIPLAFISMLAYNKSSSAIESRINMYSTQIIGQISNNLAIKNNSIANSLNEIVNNKEVLNTVNDFDSFSDAQKLDSINKISTQFQTRLLTRNSSISLAYMKKVSSPFAFSSDRNFQYDSSSLTQGVQFLIKSREASPERDLFWTTMKYPNSNSNLKNDTNAIFVGFVFNDLLKKEDTSVIGAFLKETDYSNLYKDVDLGADADLFIIDSTGMIVSSRNPEKIPVMKSYSDPLLIKNISSEVKANNKCFNMKLSGQKCLVTYSPITGTDWFMVLTVPFTYVTSDSKALGFGIGMIALIIALLSVVISYIITNSITGPLNNLTAVMGQSEKGNLTMQVQDKGRDEISELSTRFNNMIKSINILVRNVSTSSQNVLSKSDKVTGLSGNLLMASQEIAKTAHQVAEGASDQAEDSNECVFQMNDLSSSVNGMGDLMNIIFGVVKDTSKISGDARQLMDELNKKTISSKNVSAKIMNDINSLNSEMKKIRNIIKVIVGIADQTNMLSLNAAIEAARAGEAGKGFAVVASEVKSLADQSKSASVTINSIITGIQNMTEQTVTAVSDADSIFKEQMDSVIQVDESFNTILCFMSDITNKIDNMKGYVNDIFTNKQKTLESVENISAVSQQTAATVEQVSASTEELSSGSNELMSLASNLSNTAKELNMAISSFIIE